MNISKALNYARISSAVDNLKEATKTQYNKFSETKSGKIVLSILNFVKKVANAPTEFVKKHPKAIIATGLITTLIGGITANVPAVAIGMTLVAAGALAQSSNRHAERQENNPVEQVPQEIAAE